MKNFVTDIITHAGKRIEKSRFNEPPVYIGGCGRSGTTLLLSILSAHPDFFACPKELNLFEKSRIENGNVVTPKFYRLYRTFLLKKIPKNAVRYIEKSPVNIYHLKSMYLKHEGNFRLVNIVRDGRDVILSRHPKRRTEFWVSPDRWIRDVNQGFLIAEDPNVITIKYEELVKEFPQTIEKLCNFINISISDEILNWHENTSVRKNNALFTSIREINNASINKWKKTENMQRVEQLLAIPEAKKLLKKLGYKD